jgi:hypothetical protein
MLIHGYWRFGFEEEIVDKSLQGIGNFLQKKRISRKQKWGKYTFSKAVYGTIY